MTTIEKIQASITEAHGDERDQAAKHKAFLEWRKCVEQHKAADTEALEERRPFSYTYNR